MSEKKHSDTDSKRIGKQEGKKGKSGKVLRWFLIALLFLGISGLLSFAGIYSYFSTGLPKISSLRDYRPPTITTVFSDDDRKIGEFYKERRIVLPLSQMPEMLINAFVSAEDSRFFRHQGIDFYSILRAFTKNIRAGAIVQGGSTITQQVTKSFFLTPERSYNRKIKEAILAYRLDKTFSKNEILYLYLNQIYLGHGAYGVEAAAENYFGKSVGELNLAECAILAGLPQAPSRYSPFRHPDRAKQRQIYVLNRMVAEKYVTNSQATEAINRVLDIKPRRNWYSEKVPCYTEHVRRYVENKYGADALYRGGLKIHTAVNIEMQKSAREAIEKGLYALDKRQGYQGPLRKLNPAETAAFSIRVQKELEGHPLKKGRVLKGVVVNVDDKNRDVTVRMGTARGMIPFSKMRWARKPDLKKGYWEDKAKKPSEVLETGDVILVKILGRAENSDRHFLEQGIAGETIWNLALEQIPSTQAALLSIEAETGYVKAMIGGLNFKDSQFNRATQSKRQPGSAFKPVVYAAALDKGYTTASVIVDSPVVYLDEERDFTWKPNNYEKRFHGPTLFRQALTKSMNIVTIKILRDIGIDYVIDYSKKLGVTSPLSRDLSIALGSSGVSLLEMVSAYSVFTNLGYLVEPVFITKIEDRDGHVIEEALPIRNQVMEMSTAYLMTSLLQDVVEHGTGRRVKSLNRPAAGKTGTTNNLHDAWFVGYTPRYITGVWVGNDSKSPLGKGETGSRAASPIWLDFMKKALAGKPEKVFQVPEGVVFAKIDAETGLLPTPETRNTIFECFKEGTVPTESSKSTGASVNTERLFKDDL